MDTTQLCHDIGYSFAYYAIGLLLGLIIIKNLGRNFIGKRVQRGRLIKQAGLINFAFYLVLFLSIGFSIASAMNIDGMDTMFLFLGLAHVLHQLPITTRVPY